MVDGASHVTLDDCEVLHASNFGAPPSCGILLIGKSGSGKSDLALRLIAAGAQLVADDRTDLYVHQGTLYATSPARIAGLLEVRGVGILAFPHAKQAKVTLVAELGKAPQRLPDHRSFRVPAALRLLSGAAPPRPAPAPAGAGSGIGVFDSRSSLNCSGSLPAAIASSSRND